MTANTETQNTAVQTYLVGGAVRDTLLGYPYHEQDWVVVGSNPEQMLAEGFKPVGKDFPVFLHPQSGEEYALARTERKTAPGYSGFAFHTDKSVTLEDDLRRRDLTINAMAQSSDGRIIDPYGGQQDLANKQLRHVSQAFAEDPVRILRVARFAARYHHLGFQVAEETLALMRDMVDAGEVAHLVAERVWKELERALLETSPHIFIQTLRDCGALAVILPELDALFGVPQPPQHHPEIDCGLHTLLSLQAARLLSDDSSVLLATLLHDLGKGQTPPEQWPRHIAHEARSKPLVEQVAKRLNLPKKHKQLALAVAADHTNCHRVFELKPATLLKLLQRLDAFRQPDKLRGFVLACTADSRGRTGMENIAYPQADYLLQTHQCCAAINAKALAQQGLSGPQIGEALQQQRLQALEQFCRQQRA